MSSEFHPDTHDATRRLMRHALEFQYEQLDPTAINAIQTFVLDTLGVTIAGSAAAYAAELRAGLRPSHQGAEASVLGTFEKTTAEAAAMRNAFHAHCQEFDCVHEAAVVHPLATVQPALIAYAEREGGVSGRDFMTAVAVGVDVSTTIGSASEESLRFFRPATAGIFGTTAAIARLHGLTGVRFANAMGLALAACAGTMQPHDEGLSTLALQVAAAARAAITAVDLAAAGMPGPQHWLQGPNAYLNLFEGRHRIDERVAELDGVRRITEVSHKPFPSGRATHGAVDGLLQLRAAGVDWREIERVDIFVPPLIEKLVGRLIYESMGVNYARLCLQYVGAIALIEGTIDIGDYTMDRINDTERQALARRINIIVNDNPDPNALGPQTVRIEAKSGTSEITVADTLGNPANPLSREQHLAKFRSNWQHAAQPIKDTNCDAVIDAVDQLDRLDDVRSLCALMLTP